MTLLELMLLAQSINWVQQSAPTGGPTTNGFLSILYDLVAGRTLIYAAEPGSTSIYSGGLFDHLASNNTVVRITGTGTTGNACPDDTPILPGDRHPYNQMTIGRNKWWLYGGVNQTCMGTGGNASTRLDMYYMPLNSDLTTDVPVRLTPSHFPACLVNCSLAYSADGDILFSFGGGAGGTSRMERYCQTIDNPVPGTLTANQTNLGCTVPDDWVLDLETMSGPSGLGYASLHGVPGSNKMYKFGGCNEADTACFMEIYSYTIATKTWTPLCGAGCTPPPLDTEGGSVSMKSAAVYDPDLNGGTIIYHHFVSTGGTGSVDDWGYTISADRWAQISSNTGPNNANGVTMSYGPANKLVTWDVGGMWVGTITQNTSGGATGSGKITSSGKVVIH